MLHDAVEEPSNTTFSQMFAPIREDLEKVEREFVRHVESQVGVIPQIGRYILTSGGKRIRPAVLLMAARLAGYRGDAAVLYASVVEFIHTATLVHDDIIDDSRYRRGQLAVHSKFGNDITVLLGDYLYIKSMGLALSRDTLDVIRLLCDVTLRMIEGEIYQLSKNGDIDISEDEHLDIVRRKTACLFGGCARIGGMLGGASKEQDEALEEYGVNLGIAFQLVDDLLDFQGRQSALGKPVASDLREGKITLPIIHLLRTADGAASTLVGDVVRERTMTPERWEELSRMLTQSHAIDYAFLKAEQYVAAAKKPLYVFPPSPEREALMALPDYLLSRDR